MRKQLPDQAVLPRTADAPENQWVTAARTALPLISLVGGICALGLGFTIFSAHNGAQGSGFFFTDIWKAGSIGMGTGGTILEITNIARNNRIRLSNLLSVGVNILGPLVTNMVLP